MTDDYLITLRTVVTETVSVLRQRKAIAYDRCARQLEALIGCPADGKAGSAAHPVKLWLVQIGHKHGDDYAVFSTPEAAQAHLHAYVADWWDEGLTEQYGALATLTRDEAIQAYFDAHHDALDFEFYALEELTLDAQHA